MPVDIRGFQHILDTDTDMHMDMDMDLDMDMDMDIITTIDLVSFAMDDRTSVCNGSCRVDSGYMYVRNYLLLMDGWMVCTIYVSFHLSQ